MLAQEPIAVGVEGADLRVVEAVRHEPVDPLHHLEGRPVGEGQRQDLRRQRALLRDEPRDAAGDDGRLAGPGARDDQERPGVVGHGLALASGEIGEQRRLDAEVRPAGSWCRCQLLEERELIWRRHDRWHFVDGSGGGIHPAVITRLPDRSPVAHWHAQGEMRRGGALAPPLLDLVRTWSSA